MTIRKVAVFGASGNFGLPITTALLAASFQVTTITRTNSTATFPPGIPVLRTDYTTEALTAALRGQDAAVCVVGPAGISLQTAMIDAAEAAGVQRFIVDDFGWGPDMRGLPEFDDVHALRRAQWDYARTKEGGPLTWTGISVGNPIDWALRKFPAMGFDIATTTATIFDSGEERFTGTTLAGIGQSVVGLLQQHVAAETANRFVTVLSLETCQNELLRAFEAATGTAWTVRRSTTKALMASGREKHAAGDKDWVLDLVVAQLYDEGEGRCVVAPTRGASDAELLGVVAEDVEGVVMKALGLRDIV
ncbi:unnamed protein product [Discula destructiva]